MKTVVTHRWDLNPREARQLQIELRARVIADNESGEVRSVGGVDVGFAAGMARAAIVVLSYPSLECLEAVTAERPITFPYVPGLLSFREAPAIIAAAERLSVSPDLLLVDGQGIAHPRRFGIAAHIGVLFDRPTIGCAKSRLIGEHEPVSEEQGAQVPLYDGAEVTGAVVRTRANSKPVYVSIAHRVDLRAAVDYVVATCRGYRLPEPLRFAHLAASGKLAQVMNCPHPFGLL